MRHDFQIEKIQVLLDTFCDLVPDRASNRRVWRLCEEAHRWSSAKDLVYQIRKKTLIASDEGDSIAEAQYLLEESIAKTLYNLTMPAAPFDADSEEWIEVSAISLANLLGIPEEDVSSVIS